MTIQKSIEKQKRKFQALSESRKRQIVKEAYNKHSSIMDVSTHWHGLSARQCIAAYYEGKGK